MMKSLNKLFMSLAAVAVVLFFAQCAGNAPAPAASEAAAGAGTLSGLKVAYVDVDTLLAKYNFCVDLNEAMIKKSENVRATLNQKSRELETQQSEFENKYQNNAFASQERAQQEYNRIVKLQQDLQTLSDKLQTELATEQEQNSIQLNDSIKSFMKDYIKTKGYNFVFTNTGLDNLLYADQAFDITLEVVEGLNARYSAPAK